MKIKRRIIFSVIIALLVAGATFAVAAARERSQSSQVPVQQLQQAQPDCNVCHSSFEEAWSNGAHGHSMTDTRFSQMWTDQGQPGACLVCHATGYDPATSSRQKDSVSCEACHTPMPTNHASSPSANPVPVDRTNALCARCHSDARFGLQEWQSSTHYQVSMTCTVCHDPHTAALKTVKGSEDKGPSGLCVNCHSEVAMKFPYSAHNKSGVSCVDCHLRHFESQTNEDIHAMPDHSFTASLATCTTCHAEQMHTEGGVVASTTISPTLAPDPTATVAPAITQKPSPVSPAGFSGLAGLLGLAGGMVLQPWLERLYHKINGRRGSKNEQPKN